MTLRAQQNEFITMTGPGTPMGECCAATGFPCCWPRSCPERLPAGARQDPLRAPAGLSRQPRTLWADRRFCAHRGVSLWFGRNEECGMRCPYHGWKFDFTGQCIEVPSEPEESGFAKKISSSPIRWSSAAACCGPTWGRAAQAAAAGMGVRMVPSGAALRLQAPAGVQLAAGDGRRHRFQPRLLPASRQHQLGSRCSRAPRAINTIQRRAAGFEWWRAGRALHRGTPQCRGG